MIDCPVCGDEVELSDYDYNEDMCFHCLTKQKQFENDVQEVLKSNDRIHSV